MSEVATLVVAHARWLSQGDVFAKVPVLRAGITDHPRAELTPGPALLISHGCAIDKKRKGRSRLKYLSFLPIHDVTRQPPERQATLRNGVGKLDPYEVMYLGEIPTVGEGYVGLVEPFTLPAVLFQTDLQQFTDAETGEGDDARVVPRFHDTRVGTLDSSTVELLHHKWMIHWTRLRPAADNE